jgi:hypothetical protein
MANWRVIDNTGQTLARLLREQLAAIGVPTDVRIVTPSAFPALSETAIPFVSLFLYQVVGNAEMRGNPRRVLSDGTLTRQPLPLEFCYLVTAWGARGSAPFAIGDDITATREEAQLLGGVLKAFYEKAEMGRGDLFEEVGTPVWSAEDGMQIVLESLPVDGHYRIWDAAELGYRLSLVYRVRIASLEPDVPPSTPPVVEASLEATP